MYRGLALLTTACVAVISCTGTPRQTDLRAACFSDPERLSGAVHRAINTVRGDSGRAPVEHRADSAPVTPSGEPSLRRARSQLTVSYEASGRASREPSATPSDADCAAIADAILSAMLQDAAHTANLLAPEAQTVQVLVQERAAAEAERSFTVELLFDWH